ncbi:hypothetical protein FRC17_000916 [Serendipita sp. 399]|nr:hypothetical protein FRC17_000916 [Serendipita sp. 399]
MGKVAKGLHAGRIETDRASPTITVSVALWQQQQGRIADLEAQLAEARQEITRLKERKDHWKSRNEKHKADYRAMKERCKEAEETLETFTGAAEGRPAFEFDSDADKEQTVSDTLKEGNPTGTKTALALPADFDQRRSEFYDEYRPKVVKVKPGKSANGLPVTAQRPDLTVSALGLPRGQVFPLVVTSYGLSKTANEGAQVTAERYSQTGASLFTFQVPIRFTGQAQRVANKGGLEMNGVAISNRSL